jgi:hypothetical protein
MFLFMISYIYGVMFFYYCASYLSAGMVSLWYFQHTPEVTFWTAVKAMVRQMGSLAFMSAAVLPITIIRTTIIWLMKLELHLIENHDPEHDNCLTLVRLLKCCCECFWCCVRCCVSDSHAIDLFTTLNQNAGVIVALTGKNFTSAAKACLVLIYHSPYNFKQV